MSEQAAVASPPARRATRRVVSNHPNASVALGTGSGLGPLVIWVVGWSGVSIPPEAAAAIGGMTAACFLLIGRRGIKGAILGIWHGEA
jgi:hypothetical protein